MTKCTIQKKAYIVEIERFSGETRMAAPAAVSLHEGFASAPLRL